MSPRLGDLFLSSQSDERLVSLARAGHERAFAVIVERYRPELLALARRLSSHGKGEDIVQQAFLSAFAALRSGTEVGHLRGWLYQIVRNAATRSRAPACVPLDGADAGSETLEELVQQRATALGALIEMARLPSRQREAMVGTTLDGRPRAEIASAMGLSEGAVRQLVHRARAQLRTVVTAVTPWPLAKWFAGARPGAGGAGDMAVGVGAAGAASSGGVVLKLGALLASGTIATGAAVVDIQSAGNRTHRGTARAAVSHAEQTHGAGARAGQSGASAQLAAATFAAQSTVHVGSSARHRDGHDDGGAGLERHGQGEDSSPTPSRHRGGDDGVRSGGGSGSPSGSGSSGSDDGGSSVSDDGGSSGTGGSSSSTGGGSNHGGGTSGPGPSGGSDTSGGGGDDHGGSSSTQSDGGSQPQAGPQPVAAAAVDTVVSDDGGITGGASGDPDGHGGSGGGSDGHGGSSGGSSGGRDGGSGSGH